MHTYTHTYIYTHIIILHFGYDQANIGETKLKDLYMIGLCQCIMYSPLYCRWLKVSVVLQMAQSLNVWKKVKCKTSSSC